MSSITIASLSHMRRETLASILASPAASKLAIVDVRDSDHIGGHIRSSIWVPSNQLDYRTPDLIRQLKDKEQVVFHCALSQQRGPSAALRYAKERLRLLNEKERQGQEVFVLDGGFNMWQAKYGEDKTLTEGYVKDLWMG